MGKWRYGVIMDAGSSGTRVHVYRWLNSARARNNASKMELLSLPEVNTKAGWTLKTHPGVSEYATHPKSIGPKHLKGLLEHALDIVPPEEVENTPVFLLATAGMRLLPKGRQKALLKEICSYTRKNTRFQVPDCDLHIQVIKGETEGLYGWIAANYLIGGFDADAPKKHHHGKNQHTYGFLDMGGASAQIAFVPSAAESKKHEDDLTLLRLRTVGGNDVVFNVFTTTWLEFGVHEARRRYLEDLKNSVGEDEMELPDPCLPSGLKVTEVGDLVTADSDEAKGMKPYLLGTGKFQECMHSTYPLLGKNAPCDEAGCLLNGVHAPAIDFDVNHFVGVSEYWYTTNRIFKMAHKEATYDFSKYQELVEHFCTQDWTEIKKGMEGPKEAEAVNEEEAMEVCFKSAWLINVLHEGIGVPRVGLEHKNSSSSVEGSKDALTPTREGFLDPFQAVESIHDVEVSWTLGKMILYASSQIPSTSSADSVPLIGFGSNRLADGDSDPTDFQPAGGVALKLPNDLTDESDGDWHDALFDSDSPRRIPGLFLFILILAVAAFLLCGRDRRNSLYRRVRRTFGLPPAPSSFSRRRGGLPGSKFFGGGSANQSYERVMESAYEPSEFELADDAGPGYFGGPGNGLSASYEDYPSSSSSFDGGPRLGPAGSTRLGRTSGWATPHIDDHPVGGAGGAAPMHGPTSAPAVGLGLGLGGMASPRGLGASSVGPVLRAGTASPARLR